MFVILLLLMLGTICFFVPRKYMRCFFVFSAIVISAAFFLYTPPRSDDLSRYFSLFDIVEKLSLRQFLDSSYGTDDWLWNFLLNDYKENTETFAYLLFAISRTGNKGLLVFFFSLLTYLPLLMLVWEICEDEQASKSTICLCFITILACIDFRFVSCLRNLSAYAMFSYIVYRDLVKKDNTFVCFCIYIILCKLHMACLVLLAMRVLLEFTRGRSKWLIVLALSCTQMLSSFLSYFINSTFSSVSLFLRLAEKIEDYFVKRTNYNVKGSLFFVGSIFVVILIYLSTKKLLKQMNNKHEKYETFFLYMVAFTVGCMGQYDVLMRNCELVVMLGLPYIAKCLSKMLIVRSGSIRLVSYNGKGELQSVITMVAFVGLIVLSFMFYTLFSYLPMDQGFFG